MRGLAFALCFLAFQNVEANNKKQLKAGQNMSIQKRKSTNVTASKKRYLDGSHPIYTYGCERIHTAIEGKVS